MTLHKLKILSIVLALVLAPGLQVFADKTTKAMIGQIDYLNNRHETLAENIANSSTPKFKAKDLEKPDLLSGENKKVKAPRIKLRITNKKHIRSLKNSKKDKYEIMDDKSGAMKPNKNNVDLAKQIQKLSSNSDEMNIALKNYRSAMDLIATAADPAGGHR